jgi:hypothetical protein
MQEETPTVETLFHIDKLLDYLPVIIIAIIFLVGFFTWDVVRKEMASFIMLILIFVYAIWVLKVDTKSYRNWLDGGSDDIFSPPPTTDKPFGEDWTVWNYPIPKHVGFVIGIISAVAIGLGLGFGSISINNRAAGSAQDTIGALTGFGGIFSISGIILVLYSLWKLFRDRDGDSGTSDDRENDKSSTKRAGLGGFIGSVLGFYMIARAKNMENEQKEILSDEVKKTEYMKNPVNNGASGVLVSGLVIQVCAFAVMIGVLYASGKFQYDGGVGGVAVAWAIKGIIIVAFFMCGIVWIAKSQNWPGFQDADTGAKSVDSFDNNVFAAHGGIYMIFAVACIVFSVGGLKKSNTYFFSGWIMVALFIGCYIWNFMDMNQQSDITDEQKKILKEEVGKELRKNAPDPTSITDAKITETVTTRIETNQKPSKIINIVFSTLSVIILLMITIFRNTRLRMGICGGLPLHDAGFFKNIITSIFIKPVADDNDGYCEKIEKAALHDATKDTKAYGKIIKHDIDNVTGTEWDSLLNTYVDDGNSENFNKSIVRTAKGAMWVPFLLTILIVLWVAIVFARVSTSEATNNWIAQSFSGEMFPKVKELIDTFFIVVIVGLLLCGILLLPVVKELNVGGLDTLLRMVESVQVWQYDNNTGVSEKRNIAAIIVTVAIAVTIIAVGLPLLFTKDVVPKDTKWIVGLLIVLIAICFSPGWYFIISEEKVAKAFNNETIMARLIRLFFTGIYLIPWFLFTLFKMILFGLPGIFNQDLRDKFTKEFKKLAFWEWTAGKTDLRLFTTGAQIKPESVTSVVKPDYSEDAKTKINDAAAAATADPAAKAAKEAMDKALEGESTTIEQTKVGAIGKLIKVILLTISFVIMILTVIYYVYKIGANSRISEEEAAAGGFVAQLNTPTAHAIYVIMAIVAIAGFVAYIREKFTEANTKTPEDYLFDDYKPEDTNSPMRQLTFGMTHIIYIILMIIVWVYDTEKDDKNRMSITGTTILGLAILFFHYFLEFIDNRVPGAPKKDDNDAEPKPTMAPMYKLLTNIRFIVNTVFFILLCVLAYYKQHSVMVVLIVFMFLFHLTKSILGMKFLRVIWLCIIYIPCLFLALLTKSQSAVGDTTRPIWIILAIEILLIAILYGGPYLLNYIGASKSQIIAAPVPLRPKNDTGLNAQSPQIFIFHNTELNRSPDDAASGCPAEEKKRYNYSVSGWFWLNNNVNVIDKDLEIFNFGGVPKLTYNPSTTEFIVSCKTVKLDTGMSDISENIIYNSRSNYSKTKGRTLSDIEKTQFKMLNDLHTTDIQIPIQKWNYFVINYDGKSMDVFLNNLLVAKSSFLVPDITLQSITSGGDDSKPPAKPQGLSGNICNVTFHKEPMTLEQIRWTYNMLKSQDPPMVGMKTIADEVKTSGSTNVYSQ